MLSGCRRFAGSGAGVRVPNPLWRCVGLRLRLARPAFAVCLSAGGGLPYDFWGYLKNGAGLFQVAFGLEIALFLALLHGGFAHLVVHAGGAAFGDVGQGGFGDDFGGGGGAAGHGAGAGDVAHGAEAHG